MKINAHDQYLLRNLYFYDIESCHYQILSGLGYDLSNIDETDKLRRNTQIGIMMRDNPRLVKILRNITTSTIDSYLKLNRVRKSQIVLRQYDGILLTKRLEFTDEFIPLPLRTIYDIFIISLFGNSYLAYDGVKEKIKGVRYLYPEMEYFLKKILKFNFIDKRTVFRQLQDLKDEILFSSNPLNFVIPDGDSSYVFLKDFGQTKISRSLAKIMDASDIDRIKYFELYIEPFTKAIAYHYLSERTNRK